MIHRDRDGPSSPPLDFNGALIYGRGSRAGGQAWVAQLVEQRIENPRVGGSNPPPGTISPTASLQGPRPLKRTAWGLR